jgi:hypothetical protein
MAARIRTLNFLPEVFQTPTNAQFLGATLDQIVDQPNTMKIEGYVGSKFGYGINAKDKYVVEPTKTRVDYQLDPAVVFTKTNTATAVDFISYPGITDAVKLNGGIVDNNDRLFNSQFYSWDPFVDLDKLINFNQYYWLPTGAPAVTVGTDVVYNASAYTVQDSPNAYNISSDVDPAGSANPTLTLIRGGSYTFNVGQNSPFWIQGKPGVTGLDPTQLNIQTRDVLGVDNNGAETGVVTFNVPYKNAQEEYDLPGNNTVDVVSTIPFDLINGQLLSFVKDIDGVTSLDGRTVMFYDTGIVEEMGFIGPFYDTTLFDENGGTTYTYPGTSANDTNFGGGYYTDPSATVYLITYVGSAEDPVLKLVPYSPIPTQEKITVSYGTQWKARNFYRNVQGVINVVPYLSSLLDTLYYQDGTVASKVGVIKLINSNVTNQINVYDILGKKSYTAPNGVVFTNGLKITFTSNVYPSKYSSSEYYVQGVGTAIELLDVADMIAPEPFTSGTYTPYDTLPYDVGNYDSTLYVPVYQDYMTIARNSIDKNAWSRSNRWFHIDVINATAKYLNNPTIATTFATKDNKAKRPVIEFYPNLKLFDNGISGQQPVDFFDTRTTDAFTQVAGQYSYYPDVEVYTTETATIAGVTAATQTTLTVLASDVKAGTFQVGQYINDSTNKLPRNTQITSISGTSTLTLAVTWPYVSTFTSSTNASLVANDLPNEDYALYDGAKIIFSKDTNVDVRNKIYMVRLSRIAGSTPIITLTEVENGDVLPEQGTFAFKGFYNQGMDFHFDGLTWFESQQKTTINQAPLFDVFDNDGISFGDSSVYVGTSFKGNKLFSYGIGSGINDLILGFPLRYSSVNNVGDISFDVLLNSSTFNYVKGSTPITQKINTGYVHNFSDITTYTRSLGWQTAVAESRQYQIFNFDYVASNPVTSYTCDIAAASDTVWPNIQLYVNNELQAPSTYTYEITENSTIVTFTPSDTLVDTVIEITILSDQVSKTAYYEVPVNLQNNPFNADITTANVGDIRGQYQSIFYNNPDTTGTVFGANNYRDLGNLVPWGTKIIQNSASLALPGAFLRKTNHNLVDALQYNSQQYITFKNLLVDTINNTNYTAYQLPATMLDDALDQMTMSKTESGPFFWSDMLPSKAAYATNVYTFANSLDLSIYPLSRIYDFAKSNYYGVLVYLTRTVNNYASTTQLIINVDYTVSSDNPSLTITKDLLPGDVVTIKEYNQTYGSYVPNTPTKMGLYPSFIPEVVLDSNYLIPTYFIRGHDGSYNQLYGDYIDGNLIDFRDKVLLEFETRIYNNLKLSNVIPVRDYNVIPGFFRSTGYSYEEILNIYSQNFLNWVGQNRVEYKPQISYSSVNEFTYNYSQSANKIDNSQLMQGYWRGIYQYFYDTTQPDVAPWEMLGFTDMPTWWTNRYGPAPYTSDNLVLWGDLSQGINWNNGDAVVIPEFVRPQLLDVIPVDSQGNLVSPFDAIVGNYEERSFQHDWKVGDVAPTEFSYRRSSTWPFDLMKLLSVTKPAQFYNLNVDVDNYKYNSEFNQFLVNDRTHLNINDIEIYGNGIAKASYINWIVDYEKQLGIDATSNITSLLDNLDVRLVYRLAGFSDKTLLNFYVEKGSPNSNNASLLIPNESYDVLLYDNIPYNKIIYSGVILQKTTRGWTVFGNSQNVAYFTVNLPKVNGNYNTITVENLSVQLSKEFYEDKTMLVPYGTEFYSLQEVAQFLAGYGYYLENQGISFSQIESGLDINWSQMVAEMLYWAQSGWEVGSIINLNPAANSIAINKDSYVVQPLTLHKQNFILNQNLYPIQSTDLSVVRDGTLFTATPLNEGDTVAYGQFNISNFEHGIVFNNVTLFNDVIYNLTTGLRQNRINARGTKTADWNGTIDAQGFILNQDNILEWNTTTKYTKGSIVLHKNRYWTAIKVIDASTEFDPKLWKETNYNEIQKGMLPNGSTRSYESTLFYNTNTSNLDRDSNLLSWSLIGYRPRDYLALADLTDITQVNVYKNMIKQMGTRVAANNFQGLTLPQGGIDYDIYDNWAIKTGEFGGVLDNNFIDFKLNESELTGNPSIVALTAGTYTDGAQQEVPLYTAFNYGRPITDANVLPTVAAGTPNKLYPDAGYVNFNDITTYGYYYNDLNTAQTPLEKLYVGEYVWVADYNGTWQVYTPVAAGQLVQVINNLNSTVTLVFAEPHNLTKYQTIAIVNFDANVNGYRIIQSVVDAYKVTIALSLVQSVTKLTGVGTVMKFQSQRVEQPSDINSLPLLNTEFVKNKVWVDTNTNGDWAVYRKSINYQIGLELERSNSLTFGSAVATTSDLGYLVGDADKGEAYRYIYNPVFNRYDLDQTLTGSTSFGSYISYSNNTLAISQPTGATLADRLVKVYSLITTITQNSISLLQTIQAPSGVTNFGSATAFSDDGNWFYVSAYVENKVYVYQKSQITGLYEYSTYVTVGGLSAGDNFGYSVSTNYYGDTLIIGAPGVDTSVNNTGKAYIYERLVQNFEAQYTSQVYVPQTFTLVYTPVTVTKTATSITSNAITLNSVSGLSSGANGTAIIFTGTVFGGIALNQVYYVKSIVGSAITISLTRNGTALTLTDSTGTMSGIAQTTPLLVSVNGTLIADNNYAIIGSVLNVYQNLNAGDILTVSGSEFVLINTLQGPDNITIGEQYGYSLDTNLYGTEILIGSPFQVDLDNKEGAVYRYTDAGGKYGIITGTVDCNVTVATTILLNGYAVAIPAGNASVAANAITSANITNVTATAIDGKLVISTISNDIANINDKLNIVVLSDSDMTQLGIEKYQLTQTINDPHSQSRTQFGTVIKFNESGSFVASSPVSNRYEETTFDASDDDNYNNDTLFDNNTTQFIDTYVNAGAVYMFDYLSNYNESLSNVGQFVYAQSINAVSSDYGSQPFYGTALDFNDNQVVVGTPNFRPNTTNGQVIIYTNASGAQNWSVFRNSAPVVDVSAIQNAQLYSASTNNTLINLDYIDPLQGKILGAVAENIDITSNRDPAGYNSPNATNTPSTIWGAKQLGKLWFDTSSTKFVNYHQNDDVVYNSKWWGKVFPGSTPKVYSWVTSDVTPSNYAGPGTPKDIDNYAIEYVLNSTGAIVPVYFFWVRNANVVFTQVGKTLSDTICEAYITAPLSTGIAYFAPLLPNAFGLYNTASYINDTDTVMHIGFATGSNDDVSHSAYTLIRENTDDFLPGLPGTPGVIRPESLYNRMLESMSGVDESGAVVPDPNLPKAVQSGILSRPRQGFFYNRFNALKNYLTRANEILAQYPYNETGYSAFLYATGITNPSTGLPFYETTDYWNNINWWATGYSDSTRAAMMVPSYYDLATLNAQNGLIVTVAKNGQGLQETYIFNGTSWDRIGLQNGTIQFNSALWDYADARLGFGDNFFDTTPYDTYPSEETRYIIRALNEEMPSELNYFRNEGLILLFNYIMSETIESQNYLPWLNKTSFIDVAHTIRELLPLKVFQSDNQDFLSGYLNEVKPYHVVIKDFLFKYTGTEVWQGNVTDFDLPATYNTNLQKYITPELVYTNPSSDNQYLPTDPIWQSAPYAQWFNNQGLSITGVNDYPITTLTSYVTLNSNSMLVDNIYGFPVTGVIQIDQEQIAYSRVDRAYGILSGLTRGVNGTTITTHIPGTQIIMDLPAVLVLDAGHGYTEPPKVTAYIDTTIFPAPTRPAILKPVMNLDTILRIDVVDPGEGYAALPEILIEPSAVVYYSNENVDLTNNTIVLQSQLLQTGDLIKYTIDQGTTPISGLKVGQYYYVSVLETVPNFVISFYASYVDAVKDQNRIDLLDTGNGQGKLELSARASCVSTSIPIRENQITLRFDRTSYTSQVQNWAPGNFYGSFYAGLYNNSTKIASSSITLESSQPPIDSILASAQGAPFYVQDVSNNQVVGWSSRTRVVTNTDSSGYVTIAPSEGGAPLEGNVGPTTGFYIGMPIKFTGAKFGGLNDETVYYVSEINGFTQFKLEDGNGDPVTLSTATAPVAGLTAIIGEVTNTAVVTIDYPGILSVTSTTATTNILTSPLKPGNQGGTKGFYVGLPLFFTGQVFGNIVQNETYYVTTVIDEETFTISTNKSPAVVTATQTFISGNYIQVSSVADLTINDPVIFTNMYIAGTSVTDFGGVIAGQTYYVASIDYSTNKITVSTTVNGGSITITDDITSASNTYCTMIDQIDTVKLKTATGNMTMNVGLPISPGQVNGQQFTFYQTSDIYTNGGAGYAGVPSNLITRPTVATVSGSNYLYLDKVSGGTAYMYVNMPFKVSETVGSNLIAGTTYYIKSIGDINVDITSSSSSTDLFTAANTTGFYVDMPISFYGGIFGNVAPYVTYYITSIPDSTHFSVSETVGGPDVTLSTANGLMSVIGDNPFVTVSDTLGGSVFALATNTNSTTFTQYVTDLPTFYVSYKLGGYSVSIHTSGSGAAYNNDFTISGTIFGGTSPLNDVIVNVSGITNTGALTDTIIDITGIAPGIVEKYYLKVINDTQLEVYVNSLLTIPADGIVLESHFNSGDYVFLPEPFYFSQSIVKYNNKVWQCIVSNNDTDFILGKWKLMDNSDRRLNALDRIMGYYQPTVNMPGLDLTQLVSGISYPNNTYLDNAFPPADEYALDTVLSDQPFYPIGVNTMAIIYDGQKYVGVSNTVEHTATITNSDPSSSVLTWTIDNLANSPLGATDINYRDGLYVVTTTNPVTPLYISTDGITYTTTGTSNLRVDSTLLNSTSAYNNKWVAVGENIVTSVNPYIWAETYRLSNPGVLRSVEYVNIPSFTGWVAVGNQTIAGTTTAMILVSNDGFVWSEVNAGVTTVISNATLTSVSSSNDRILFTANDGRVFVGTSPTSYVEVFTGVVSNLNDAAYGDGIYVAVGDDGIIITSADNGDTWTESSYNSDNLNGVVYNPDNFVFVASGDNNTILSSYGGYVWGVSGNFDGSIDQTVYTVQGDAFTAGYGPEELVPAVVTDNLTMLVNTRPGSNWPVGQYGHTGFNAVSTQIEPTSLTQVEYSFANIVPNPATMAVYDLDTITNLSVRTFDFTINWVSKTITLTNPLAADHQLVIDLYEVGNGDQLEKSNSDVSPFDYNLTTGFTEIPLNCNYSATIFNGSGVIRPASSTLGVLCTETRALGDSILCDDISSFILNQEITFQGDVLGGLQSDTVYYVKTISYITNRITVSSTIIDGLPGPTFVLYDDVGLMTANIANQIDVPWTDPIVMHNGEILVPGHYAIVTQTKSSTDSIVCSTISGFSVGAKVTFDNNAFGGIAAHVSYNILSFIDGNEITIEDPANPGTPLQLTDATGIAYIIVGDYTLAQADVGVTAKIIFANEYSQADDYVQFTVFGETSPIQYGYSVPLTQVFTAQGGEDQFALSNYVEGTNSANAIVEKNGLRLINISDYSISSFTNAIHLTTSLVEGDVLSVTTFNYTERQYLNTTYGGTFAGSVSQSFTISATTHESAFDEFVTAGQFMIGVTYQIESVGTTDFTLIGASSNTVGVIFTATGIGSGTGVAGVGFGDNFSPSPDYLTLGSGTTDDLILNTSMVFSGSTFGGIVANKYYYISSIIDSTKFSISETIGGPAYAVVTGTGSMTGYVNPAIVADIININTVIAAPAQETACTDTYAIDNSISCNSIPLAASGLSVTFKGTGFGGVLTDGTTYIVDTVINASSFTIKDQYDNPVILSDASGTMIAYIGGTAAVTVVTGIPHGLRENDIVRIDGVTGSIQLNNNAYYARVVNPTTFELYMDPYDPALNAYNAPVVDIPTYTGGGYAWLDKTFTLIAASASATSSVGNIITVIDTAGLVEDTPVYFSGTLTGTNLVAGTRYYIKSIVSDTEFTVSAEYQGDEFTLSTATVDFGVSQWEQSNVDRIWVSLNGYRIPSTSLRINPNNNLSILHTITPGDTVIITNMIPTATPNADSYMLTVNKTGDTSVYRSNADTTTWTKFDTSITNSAIWVNDLYNIVDTETIYATVPNDYVYGETFTVGLGVNKSLITGIKVINVTQQNQPLDFGTALVIQDTAPVLEISTGINPNDELIITVILGNTVYINGEQIRFGRVGSAFNNTSFYLADLTRGVNNTAVQQFIPAHSTVYGMLSANKLPQAEYNQTWNSYVYNPVLGDPLQVSTTFSANFLNIDIA